MQQRTKLKNVCLIVMALLFPPFAAVTALFMYLAKKPTANHTSAGTARFADRHNDSEHVMCYAPTRIGMSTRKTALSHREGMCNR
ncbi:hypothetical protein [Vibrio parahaemolyticus]|uniref:hypothetical protein n=1 Tax=Vibrio parahaemolyticus TaxID=670 RepID=UPI0017866BB9|nr:hypothetical protein [Vibrio parahaemolyticus]MBD6945045.1 hypothetical protein [Vibrio parahaemolyticus]MBD6978942.1 hypothetical protein [Vibrio parahaemolyticus]MBD6990947.1 hypothetical protein [Vibrio parahaemolyticus]WOZ62908.1 hypothetical protein RHS38_26185 [Vibrio parahaemolyticus]